MDAVCWILFREKKKKEKKKSTLPSHVLVIIQGRKIGSHAPETRKNPTINSVANLKFCVDAGINGHFHPSRVSSRNASIAANIW